MDEDSLPNLVTVAVLLALHALITMAYAALVNTRTTEVRDQADAGNVRAQRVLSLVEGTTRLHTTYQVSIILLRFFIAVWSTRAIADPVLVANQTIAPVVVYSVVLIFAASVTLILGDIVPESIGSAHAASFALWAASPMRWLVVILSPAAALLLAISGVVSAFFGSSKLMNKVTEEEIMTLVDAGHTGGTIEEEEKDMIYSVLQLDQTVAREVMVPRIDMVALDIDTTLDEALATFIASGFSRIPVYEGNIDNIKGLAYAKDLLSLWRSGHTTSEKPIRDIIRPAYFVPENKRADDLLKEMQERKIHMAMVVDEYGGTAGLVTIENLIEEIIGDIVDEYDVNEEAEYVEQSPGEYTVDGSIDLDDFNDLLDVELPTEDSDTLGGFIYTYLGRVPYLGEVIETADLVLRVESIEGRRIRKVQVTRKSQEEPAAKSDDLAQDVTPTSEEVTDSAG